MRSAVRRFGLSAAAIKSLMSSCRSKAGNVQRCREPSNGAALVDQPAVAVAGHQAKWSPP